MPHMPMPGDSRLSANSPAAWSRREFLHSSAAVCAAAAYPLSCETAAAAEKARKSAVAEPHIRTVLGPVAADKLGVTLMHEHAPLVDWSELYEAPLGPLAAVRGEMLDLSGKLLEAFHKTLSKGEGPGAVVECTPIRVGRYPELLVEVARRTPVQIIACTGFWCEAMAPQHPWMLKLGAERDGIKKIAELYIREITQGMEDPAGEWGEKFTSIPVGIIKCATSTWLRPSERRCHEAAAIASRETGCPITTHTTDGGGLEQAQLFLKARVKPEKVIIGHQGNQDDREHEEAHEYQRRIVDLGCFVQFDRVGHKKYPVEKMARQIKLLVDAGFAKQILVSHDHVPYFYTDYAAAEKQPDRWKVEEADYTICSTLLVQSLAMEGVAADDIRKILVENPARVLAF